MGVKHGIGTFFLADGSTYKGGWANDLREGDGIETDASGSRYEGTYKNGVKDG